MMLCFSPCWGKWSIKVTIQKRKKKTYLKNLAHNVHCLLNHQTRNRTQDYKSIHHQTLKTFLELHPAIDLQLPLRWFLQATEIKVRTIAGRSTQKRELHKHHIGQPSNVMDPSKTRIVGYAGLQWYKPGHSNKPKLSSRNNHLKEKKSLEDSFYSKQLFFSIFEILVD